MSDPWKTLIVTDSVQILQTVFPIILGSYFLAKVMERYKSHETLRIAIIQEAAKEMDRISKLLFQVEYAVENMGKDLVKLEQKRKEGIQEETSHTDWVKLQYKHMDILDPKKKEAKMAIEESRFWLGKEYFNIFMRHYDLLEEYESLTGVQSFTKAKELWFKIDANRLYASDFLKSDSILRRWYFKWKQWRLIMVGTINQSR